MLTRPLKRRIPAIVAVLCLASLPTGATAAPADDVARLARQAQALAERAGDDALDRAADYWFARDAGHGRSLAGSGPALAAAIRLARAEALRGDTRPVPPAIRRAFHRHYPAKVLDRTRWLVAAPNSRLGQLLARWPVQNGAVTLHDVIVFKTPAAASNPHLFAHELTHVEQYRRLGIDRFAHRYAANRDAFEAEARDKADKVSRRA